MTFFIILLFVSAAFSTNSILGRNSKYRLCQKVEGVSVSLLNSYSDISGFVDECLI